MEAEMECIIGRLTAFMVVIEILGTSAFQR